MALPEVQFSRLPEPPVVLRQIIVTDADKKRGIAKSILAVSLVIALLLGAVAGERYLTPSCGSDRLTAIRLAERGFECAIRRFGRTVRKRVLGSRQLSSPPCG